MPANIVEDKSPIWLSGTGEGKNYGQVKGSVVKAWSSTVEETHMQNVVVHGEV